MRVLLRLLILVVTTVGLTAVAPAAAGAVGVAYIDGNEVWVSSLDGTQKVRLSNGENDWREIGQNDAGYVVATRREAGKISELATFTIWRPDGSIKDFGPLGGLSNGGLSAYPLGLDLTPDGSVVVYGFYNTVYGYPVSFPTYGFFVLPSSTRVTPYGGPWQVNAAQFPTLVGSQVVGTPDDHTLALQDPSTVYSKDFLPWPGIEIPSPQRIIDTEVSSNGRTVALGVYNTNDDPDRVFVVPTPGLGQEPVALNAGGDVGACWLVPGLANDPSFSPDGQRVAWTDPRGVVVAGTPVVQPTTPPEDLCTFSSPPLVISPTGQRPAIGGIDVGAILAARAPAPPATPGAGGAAPGGNAPVITGPGGTPPGVVFVKLGSLKVTALGGKSGASVQLSPTVSGKATLSLTVEPKVLGKKGKKPVVIATGKATLVSDKLTKVTLKFNAAGKKAAKKLKKKLATLTVKVGGTTTTSPVKLS